MARIPLTENEIRPGRLALNTMGRLFPAFLLIAALCGLSAAQTAPPPPVRVELDIFSGRPNPSWEITSAETAEFLTRFRALPQTNAGSVRDGLGYRGLIVAAKGGAIESFDSIGISNGTVMARRAQNSQRFTDKDRALEKWLLNTGKAHLDPAIYNEAAKGL